MNKKLEQLIAEIKKNEEIHESTTVLLKDGSVCRSVRRDLQHCTPYEFVSYGHVYFHIDEVDKIL